MIKYPVMPRRDRAHQTVRHALEKEGWVITHDPLMLEYGGTNLYVDLGQEFIRRRGIRLLIFLEAQEEIKQWIL